MTPAAPNGFADRFVAMGTRVECHLFGVPDAIDIAVKVRAAVEAVDSVLTIHRVSPTTLLNDRLRFDRDAPMDDPILLEALLLCDALQRATRGLFDPTAGMSDARWDVIEIDRTNARVRARHPVAIDFGGIGKGIALDHCRPILSDAGVASALLSLGESSILAHGEHPLGGDWPLTVPDPTAPGRALSALSLRDRCLSVSSTIGHANGDTISPADGAPVHAAMTAIAVDPSGATAEAFSTALMVADARQRAALKQDAVCEALDIFDLSDHVQTVGGMPTGVSMHE